MSAENQPVDPIKEILWGTAAKRAHRQIEQAADEARAVANRNFILQLYQNSMRRLRVRAPQQHPSQN